MKKGLKRKLEFENSLPIFIFAILSLGLVLFLMIFFTLKPPTGLVISEEEVIADTGKNCFFKIGSDSLSMYNCNTREDCSNLIPKLMKEKGIKDSYDLSNIEVIDCIGSS
ncbi:MAG: hypothetical protein WC867_02775 [Candidatus Pacearchaeota archaeon]|jgi:hypothetical protein